MQTKTFTLIYQITNKRSLKNFKLLNEFNSFVCFGLIRQPFQIEKKIMKYYFITNNHDAIKADGVVLSRSSRRINWFWYTVMKS